jgi:uncharacterized protein DUF2071
VPHQIELHPGGRIDRGVRLSLRIRDLVVASWKIERADAQRLLPRGLEPTPVDGDYLVSLAAMRYDGGRMGSLPIPLFSQINLRTYVAHEHEDAVYFLLSRVTVPGLAGALLGAPLGPSRIAVRPGSVEAPGLGVSIQYRVDGVTDPGPIGLHELGILGRARLRTVHIRRAPAVWRKAEPQGRIRADPVIHFGISVDEAPALLCTDEAEFELEGRPRRMLPSSRMGGKMNRRKTV